MNVAKIISSLTIGLGKAVTRAAAASGSQMVKNFNYKPEGMDQSSSSSSSSTAKAGSKVAAIQQQMSIDEAHLILNVKKEDPMEIIQKHYDAIFAANGPPPEPKTPTPAASTPPASKTGPKRKPPSHSHYLQSKVYRALERIKAERGQLDQEPPAEGGEGAAKDPAVVAAEALGAAGARAAEQAKETRT